MNQTPNTPIHPANIEILSTDELFDIVWQGAGVGVWILADHPDQSEGVFMEELAIVEADIGPQTAANVAAALARFVSIIANPGA